MSGTARKTPASKKSAASADESGVASLLATPEKIREFLASSRHEKALSFFASLAQAPPQSLLLEGGGAEERRSAALYWALLLNCPASRIENDISGNGIPHGPPADTKKASAPCLVCPVCLRILGGAHRDIFFLDGSSGSIKIDEVREIRAVLGEPPREAKKRVVILAEAQSLTEAAANAMLKSLEEPMPGTVFVLLAPQRERLLPTLVSRSWVLTLPWPDARQDSGPARNEWAILLAAFLRSGTGLFERTGGRGAMDAGAAQDALLACQQALAEAMSGKETNTLGPLAHFFASLSDERRRMADEILAEAQESLGFMVNSALVAEWMATRLYLLGGGR